MLKKKSLLSFSIITLGLSLLLTSQVTAAPEIKRLGGNFVVKSSVEDELHNIGIDTERFAGVELQLLH